MAYKMKGFPEHHGCKSPMRTHENGAVHEAESDDNSAGNFDVINATNNVDAVAGNGNMVQANTDNEATVEASTDGQGLNDDQKKWWEKDAWQDSGVGHITEAVKSIGRGIKNIRTKNKAKKEQNLNNAKTAVVDGTQTLKQQKLVDKTNKRKKRKADEALEKSNKNKVKLAKYKKKQENRISEKVEQI